MPRGDEKQAGMVADALWRALRPLAIDLIGVALACPAGAASAAGPAGDEELTTDEQARVDAALSRFRRRRRERAGQRGASGPAQQARKGRRSARLTPKGGEP